MQQILLVDDHPVVRLGVRAVLAGHGDLAVVGEATTLEDAVHSAQVHRPDLVVLDLHLEGRPLGPELCRTLKRSPAAPGVLVLATPTSAEQVTQMYLAGADSFVHRTAPPAELAATVRATIGGRRVWLPHRWPPGRPQRRHDDGSAPEQLTPREREVLGLLLHRCTNAEIAGELSLGLPTVKTHVSAVLRKLGLTRRSELFLRDA